MPHLTHNLKGSIDLASKIITIDEEMVDSGVLHIPFETRQALTQHYRTVVDTKDQMIRDALIRLGWTPPPDGLVLHSRREGSDPADLQRDNDPPQDKNAGSPG